MHFVAPRSSQIRFHINIIKTECLNKIFESLLLQIDCSQGHQFQIFDGAVSSSFEEGMTVLYNHCDQRRTAPQAFPLRYYKLRNTASKKLLLCTLFVHRFFSGQKKPIVFCITFFSAYKNVSWHFC